MLIDTHCHLDFPQLKDSLADVLSRAKLAGVKKMISISTRIAHFPDLLSLANSHSDIYCTIGTHPHHCAEVAEMAATTQDYINFTTSKKVVGIGEAGLDYHYDYAPRELQEKSFRMQIEAARETGLPLVVHAREADTDIADILEDEMKLGHFTGVLHCYSSGAELAKRGLDIGFYISFSGIVTFKNARDIQAIAKATPLNRLLVETDAPYLAPVPHRGKTNEPSYVAQTAQFLATYLELDYNHFEKMVTNNSLTLFSRLNDN